MRKLLEARGVRLTKSLGQCFLHDPQALDRIAATAELSREDPVLEIGAGLGPLTERLIEAADLVCAVEKDARLVEILEERFRVTRKTNLTAPSSLGLQLVHADALAELRRKRLNWSNWAVVSNLPYSVASPILVELCQGDESPKRIVVTLQFEVAQRLMSQPGTKDYGVLTLLVQLDYSPGGSFKIPATSFFPRPDVDSACIRLDRRASPLLPESERRNYVRIVKRAFSQRRKMMLKLLKQDWRPEALEAAYAKAGIAPTIRAEAVTLLQFVELTRSLSAS